MMKIEVPEADSYATKYTDTVMKNRVVWAEALDSGDYEQGVSFLARKEDSGSEFKYCCLGVACEISGDVFDVEIRGKNSFYKTFNGASATPDFDLLWLMGMNNNLVEMLMSLNDSQGMEFKEIAKVVLTMPVEKPSRD